MLCLFSYEKAVSIPMHDNQDEAATQVNWCENGWQPQNRRLWGWTRTKKNGVLIFDF